MELLEKSLVLMEKAREAIDEQLEKQQPSTEDEPVKTPAQISL